MRTTITRTTITATAITAVRRTKARGSSWVRWSRWRFRRWSSAPSPSGRCCSVAASASPSSCSESTTTCVGEIGDEFHGWLHFALHGMHAAAVLSWSSLGVFSAWALYIKWPHLPDVIDSKLKPLRWVLENKYCFDWFNENVIARRQPPAGQDFLEGRRPVHHRQRSRSMARPTRSASSPASCAACRAASSIPMRSGWSSDSPSCSAGS